MEIDESESNANADEGEAAVDLVIEKLSTSKEESGAYVSLSIILPVPKAQPRKKRAGGRKKGSTKILTETLVRNEIARQAKEKVKGKRNTQ